MGNQASDGAYFTRPAAATLTAKLALDACRGDSDEPDWADERVWKAHKAIDLACGSGTLLAALLADMKRRARAAGASEQQLADLQRLAVENVIKGMDINPVSLQLAAAQLTQGNQGHPLPQDGPPSYALRRRRPEIRSPRLGWQPRTARPAQVPGTSRGTFLWQRGRWRDRLATAGTRQRPVRRRRTRRRSGRGAWLPDRDHEPALHEPHQDGREVQTRHSGPISATDPIISKGCSARQTPRWMEFWTKTPFTQRSLHWPRDASPTTPAQSWP